MTLFWHNHFTSIFHKVKWPALLYRQNVLLRYHAVGSFRESIFQVAKDPYVTAKLWREFVSDQPDPTEVERLATSFSQQRLLDQAGPLRAIDLLALLDG